MSAEKLRMAMLNLAASWYPPRRMAMEDCARELRGVLEEWTDQEVTSTVTPVEPVPNPASPPPAWTGADSLEHSLAAAEAEVGPENAHDEWETELARRAPSESLEESFYRDDEPPPSRREAEEKARYYERLYVEHLGRARTERADLRRKVEQLVEELRFSVTHLRDQQGETWVPATTDPYEVGQACDVIRAEPFLERLAGVFGGLKPSAGPSTVALFLRDVAELEPASPEAEDSIIVSVGDLEIIAERYVFRERQEELKKIKMAEDAKWFEVPGRDDAKGLTVAVNPDGSIGLWPLDPEVHPGFSLTPEAARDLETILRAMLPGEIALAAGPAENPSP